MATDKEIAEAQEKFGMGLIPRLDPLSRAFPVNALLPAGAPLPDRSYTWSCPIVLHQGETGTCVGHAFVHELAARPQSWPVRLTKTQGINFLAWLVYTLSCQRDPWPQNDGGDLSFGTDPLSAVKVLVDMGLYGEYRHAFSHAEVRTARGYFGPGILSIPWYNSMYFPKADGRLEVVPSSGLAGYHAIFTNGQHIGEKLGRWHNSWGEDWGLKGECFVSFEDEEKVLAKEVQGSFMIPLKRTSV